MMLMLSGAALAAEWSARPPASIDGVELGAVGFARLVLQQDARLVGTAPDDWGVWILERLSSHGYPVSAPDPVFGGTPVPARYVLGGTAHDLDLTRYGEADGWTLAVDWELRDARTDRPVYRTTTRGFANTESEYAAAMVVESAVDQLVARESFVAALAFAAPADPATSAVVPQDVAERAVVDDPPDPSLPVLPRGTLCVYRAPGEMASSMLMMGTVTMVTTAPSRYVVGIGYDLPIALDHAEYTCSSVPAGRVPVEVSGGPGRWFDVSAGETVAVMVIPPSAIVTTTQLRWVRTTGFERVKRKLMEADRD